MRAVIFILAALPAFAQIEKFNHVQWTAEAAGPGLVKLQAQIDPGWHMYSLTTPPGPIPTAIRAVDSPAVKSSTVYEPPPIRKFDPNFNAETETYEGSQTFYVRVDLSQDSTVTFEPRYQTCSGSSCIPPRTRRVSVALTAGAAAAIPAG